MQIKEIDEVRILAHSIDCRINLFDGYNPKECGKYQGELLFWRQIVSLYGLFSDCDPVQIKNEKQCLIELLYSNGLINNSDYRKVFKLWKRISHLRKWFCHNINTSRYYSNLTRIQVEQYLKESFASPPQKIEEITDEDWKILSSELETGFVEYLNILKKGFMAWNKRSDKEELINKWLRLLSIILAEDSELLLNVLADLAKYQILFNNLNVTVDTLARKYRNDIINNHYLKASDIEYELQRVYDRKRSNEEIIKDAILQTNIL